MTGESLFPLIVVLGPTASGKSELALNLAGQLNGEIVNFDSLQLYRFMNIGTAKTPPEERRGIPHHLLDVFDPDQTVTAGQYARLARQTLSEIAARGRVPVLVGGTGFYLRALLDGLFDGPTRDEPLRERLAARPAARLHKILKKIDTVAAARIHPNDTKKIIRAIEVCLTAHRKISELQPEREPLPGFDVLKLGLDPPRTALHEVIDTRCKTMFERGIIDETHFVVGRFGSKAKALEAIGYTEALGVLAGSLTYEEALTLAQRNTRRYAKRQMTWFRKEASTKWLLSFGNQIETIELAIRTADEHIKKYFVKSERMR